MLRHPTLDQLHALGLQGMAKAFADIATADQAKDCRMLIGSPCFSPGDVMAERQTPDARLRAAKLRQQASVEDVDYRAARGLDRALFQKLADGEWIDAHDNLALVGPSGVGKSWLACAIGQKACRDNRSVSIIAGRSSARTWRSPEAMDVIRASSNPSAAPICSYSTTSVSNLSMPARVMICSKSSRSDTGADQQSSPLSFPCPPGMTLLGTPPTRTPSWTASSTTRIGSS